jgi:hypothetical protein
MSKGADIYTMRDDVTPVTSNALASIHVPMCIPCNHHLGVTIEEPAKELVRRLLAAADGAAWPTTAPDESAALARWLLKVGLLGAHPKGVHDNPQVNADPEFPRFDEVEPVWLEWMRVGDPPPDGFSVYIARRSVMAEDPWEGEKLRIVLPDIHVDGKNLRYSVRRFGMTGVDVTIVWHPGWPITHPLADEGRAATLWPHPPAIDFNLLPEGHPAEFGFVTGFAPIDVDEEKFLSLTETPIDVETDPISLLFGDTAFFDKT